jgi:hypothetical protein
MTFERLMLLLGVAVGLLLLAFGIYQYQLGIPSWRLCFCVGFGIILASFGTVANAQTKMWTITGAGAITVILYWITATSGQQYAIGFINGDFPEGTVAYVRDVQDLPGGFTENKRNYRVVLLETQLQSEFLEIEVRRPADRIPVLLKVKRDYVQKYTSQGKNFTWILSDRKLLDIDGHPVPIIGEFATGELVPPGSFAAGRFSLIGTASAQMSPPAQVSVPARAVDPQLLAGNLSSPDYQVRRDARNALVELDIKAIRPALDALAKQPDPASDKAFEFYNVLTSIQRKNEKNSTAIRNVLTDQDFPLLMHGVAGHEKEVRLLATEFLYGISDKRALAPSLDLLQKTNDQDVQWNAVLIIKSFFSNLPRDQQQSTAAILKSANVGPKTKAQIDSFAVQ